MAVVFHAVFHSRVLAAPLTPCAAVGNRAGNTGEKQKKYFKSQNLAQPIVERFSSLEPVSFEGFDVVYFKEYDQLVPNLHGGDPYAPRSVRYTKITKELGREVAKDGSSQNGR